MAASSENKPDIVLNSPVGAKPAIFKWPLTYVTKGQKIDGAEEIIETIRWVSREYIEFKPAIENLLPDQLNLKSYDCIKGLCDKYNKITELVAKMNKGTSVALKTSSRASQGLLKHIIQQVYNYAVVEPNELNKYSPFSSETYGETSFEFMAQLIDRNQFRPRDTDVFIDMGSGVGHLVLQMAATVKCKKCYGIEIADVPAGYAKLMEERFKFWMNWHGKFYTDFELFHGDFFDKNYADIIKNATHILVNNFAFKPEVDHKLKQRFLDLKDGTQILSSKPFCSIKSRVNERNLTDIGSIMHVVEIYPDLKKDSVSWTPKPLPYYLHVLDGSRVERYYEKQKRRAGRVQTDKGKPSKRRRTGKAGSDSMSDDSDDNTVFGPTTRKAWSEWCNASSMNASNRTSTDSVKTTPSRNNSTDTEALSESAIDEDHAVDIGDAGPAKSPSSSNETVTLQKPAKESNETQRSNKRSDSQPTIDKTTANQDASAQSSKNQSTHQAPKSALDKKREYAVKKGSIPSIQDAPPSALYSISKPAESTSGQSSTSKIPNIVIKVKAPIDTKIVSDTKNGNNPTEPDTHKSNDQKSNTENGAVKKLRQRRKSVPQQDQNAAKPVPTAKPTKSKRTDARSATANSILNPASATVTRAKKIASNVKPAPSKSTSAAKKKATSPEKNVSLDLLHAKTVESVSGAAGFYLQPAPGCEDHQLQSIVATPSLPNVVIKDSNMFASTLRSTKSIDKLIDSTKQEFERFASKMQQPRAKDALLRSIEIERLRNRELQTAEEDLKKHIKFLDQRIPKVMKSHCDELGVKSANRKGLVCQLGLLLKKHQDLLAYQQQLEMSLLPAPSKAMNPPAAHSNTLPSPYRVATSSATLDLSLKPVA